MGWKINPDLDTHVSLRVWYNDDPALAKERKEQKGGGGVLTRDAFK